MGWFWKSKPKTPTRMCPSGHAMEATWLTCPHCPARPHTTERVATAVTAPPPQSQVATRTTVLVDKKRPPVVGWLIALDGKHKGEDFKIVEGKNKIGKNADCDVVITDEFVSSEHALVYYDKAEKQFLITDLGATNGTYVYEGGEYKKIASRELLDNDTLRLGETQLRFKCLG